MTELYVGARVRVVSDIYEGSAAAKGATGTVDRLGLYVWVATKDGPFPFESDELELIPNLPATDTGD